MNITYSMDLTFDYALPQSWIDETLFNSRDYIWVYPDNGFISGIPLPLNREALRALIKYYCSQNQCDLICKIIDTIQDYAAR